LKSTIKNATSVSTVMPPLVGVEFEKTRVQSSGTCTGDETYAGTY